MVIDYERKGHSAEEYLHLLSDLTEREVIVTRTLYKEAPRAGIDPWY